MYRPVPLSPEEQQQQATTEEEQSVVVAQVSRTDVPVPTGAISRLLNYRLGTCTTRQTARVPAFTDGASTVGSRAFPVPLLTKGLIQSIKSFAESSLPVSLQNSIAQLRTVDGGSGFTHPGAFVGPAELAVLKNRNSNPSMFPVQASAKASLLDGTGVPAKRRPGTSWTPPTNCPVDYAGPYAMAVCKTKYSGFKTDDTVCAPNYPAPELSNICGHVSFVELDGQMAYKQAMAWHVTNIDAYALKVFDVADKWATVNTAWGLNWENGPLEAGWGIAAMARALELVRNYPNAPSGVISRFVSWVQSVPMKDMDHYIYNLTPQAKAKNMLNWYGNWHSTIAEAYMSVGVLSDNRTMYNQGVQVIKDTIDDYLKWGKGAYATNRIRGECSETMRDMYHSQFGLGGLLQAAEIAWQQDEDLYSYGGYALAAAMELHARVTNAGKEANELKLPPNYRFYNASNMPPLPTGATAWKFDIGKQLWIAVDANGRWVADLRNGIKYMLGIGFLPTGWELGYNHYVGRLNMRLPETALMLSRSWPEWQEFHWGLGTISHAMTAERLWRPGVVAVAVCSTNRLASSNSSGASQVTTATEAVAPAEDAEAATTSSPSNP